MILKKWNRADKTLAFVTAIFIVSLIFLSYARENIFLQCVCFCSEAAMIGGIADWFAVTALFERPLGIKYHTAILPNRRNEFMEAMVTLIQNEIFSYRKIFSLGKNIKLNALIIGFFKKSETQDEIKSKIHSIVDLELRKYEINKTVEAFAEDINAALLAIPAVKLIELVSDYIKDRNGLILVKELSNYLIYIVDTPAFRAKIIKYLEEYQAKKVSGLGLLGGFLSGLASAMGVLDLEEAADIVHKNIIDFLVKVNSTDSKELHLIHNAIIQRIELLKTDEPFVALVETVKNEFVQEVSIKDKIYLIVNNIKEGCFNEIPLTGKELISFKQVENPVNIIEDFLFEQIQEIPDLMDNNNVIREKFGCLMNDITGRSLLFAKDLTAAVIRDAFARLSDEDLNNLVYKKIEPDMLWIRMNGSIVGAAIGFCMFVLTQVVKGVIL